MGRRRLDDTIFSSLSARRRQSLRRLQLFHHEYTIALGERWRRDGRRRRRRYSPEAFSRSPPPEKRSRSRSRSRSRRRRPNCSVFQLAVGVGMHYSFDSSRRHRSSPPSDFSRVSKQGKSESNDGARGGVFLLALRDIKHKSSSGSNEVFYWEFSPQTYPNTRGK